MNKNIQGDFQIGISVPLSQNLLDAMFRIPKILVEKKQKTLGP